MNEIIINTSYKRRSQYTTLVYFGMVLWYYKWNKSYSEVMVGYKLDYLFC